MVRVRTITLIIAVAFPAGCGQSRPASERNFVIPVRWAKVDGGKVTVEMRPHDSPHSVWVIREFPTQDGGEIRVIRDVPRAEYVDGYRGWWLKKLHSRPTESSRFATRWDYELHVTEDWR